MQVLFKFSTFALPCANRVRLVPECISYSKNGTATTFGTDLQMHRTVHTYERFGNTLCVTFFNSFHLRWNASSGIIATKTFASQTLSYILIGIHFSYTRAHTLTLIVGRRRRIIFCSILNENNSATHASSHRHEWMRNLEKTPSVCVCVEK